MKYLNHKLSIVKKEEHYKFMKWIFAIIITSIFLSTIYVVKIGLRPKALSLVGLSSTEHLHEFKEALFHHHEIKKGFPNKILFVADLIDDVRVKYIFNYLVEVKGYTKSNKLDFDNDSLEIKLIPSTAYDENQIAVYKGYQYNNLVDVYYFISLFKNTDIKNHSMYKTLNALKPIKWKKVQTNKINFMVDVIRYRTFLVRFPEL